MQQAKHQKTTVQNTDRMLGCSRMRHFYLHTHGFQIQLRNSSTENIYNFKRGDIKFPSEAHDVCGLFVERMFRNASLKVCSVSQWVTSSANVAFWMHMSVPQHKTIRRSPGDLHKNQQTAASNCISAYLSISAIQLLCALLLAGAGAAMLLSKKSAMASGSID